ncbi:MAG: DUF378 domain-containing protein [Armatimonadota bacterium]
MKALNTIVLILVIVGGLNWGLVGIAGVDLVAGIFGGDFSAVGEAGAVGSIVYVLVGIAAIWALSFFGLLGPSASRGRGPMAPEQE